MPHFAGVISETGQQRSGRVDVVCGKYVFVTTIGMTQFAVDNGKFGNTVGGSNPQCTRPRISLATNVGMRRMVYDSPGHRPWLLIAWRTEQSPP